uniref:Reverse transcriptase/retrotransposon-derived protein RNase H-like domain-containing protein n=1 Tax=Cyprinus carpio TaxID=7962 RepID=A0A8C1S3V5_CYPCA
MDWVERAALSKTKPNDVLEWTDEHEQVFTDLKQRLLVVHKNTLSGVLAQEHGGKLRPIAYYSRKKSLVEQGRIKGESSQRLARWL